MFKLKNVGPEVIKQPITRVPISNARKSPNPGLVFDPENPGKKIENPNLITKTDEIIVKPGETVEFKGGEDRAYNKEQGEHLYKMMGQPEMGGHWPMGDIRVPVKNKNYLIEVKDDKDEEDIKGKLFAKYRVPSVPEVMKAINRDEPLQEPKEA